MTGTCFWDAQKLKHQRLHPLTKVSGLISDIKEVEDKIIEIFKK